MKVIVLRGRGVKELSEFLLSCRRTRELHFYPYCVLYVFSVLCKIVYSYLKREEWFYVCSICEVWIVLSVCCSWSRNFWLWYKYSIVFYWLSSKATISCSVVFRRIFGCFRQVTRWLGGRSFVDGISRLCRLNETVFDLVSGGFVGWSFKRELSEKYFSICSWTKSFLGNMVLYCFYDGWSVYQRNLRVYTWPM